MTIFREGEPAPPWCTVRAFETIALAAGQDHRLVRKDHSELLFVTYGVGLVSMPDLSVVIREHQFLLIPNGVSKMQLSGTSRPVEIVRFTGNWGPALYGASFFRVGPGVSCPFVGDPVTYPKNTPFDSHYHDYDEYWVILEGSGRVVIGDTAVSVRRGDCVAIGAGYHHDFPLIDWPVKALAIEVSITGQRRLGHLWTHTHGPAVPRSGVRPTAASKRA